MNTEVARQRLLQEKERLSSTASSGAQGLAAESERFATGELSAVDQHQADVATETFEREKELAILRSLEEQLEAVDAALERLDEGTYGKCEACGADIGDERLDAVPTTRFCVNHAREV